MGSSSKLKRSAQQELINGFPGWGWLMLSMPHGVMVQLNIGLGKNGSFYTGTGKGRLLSEVLEELVAEIRQAEEEDM